MTEVRIDLNSEQIVSAQILLRPASGKKLDGRSRIVAENIQEWAPSAEAIDFVSKKFRSLGFNLGEPVGNTMSITGPVHLFESAFKVRLDRSQDKGFQFKSSDGTMTYQLPEQHIPPAIAQHVAAITFTPPPDFGPTSFSS